MADHRRADRVAEAIREEVASFLTRGAKDPRLSGLITVTAVDVTQDLRRAVVFVSVLGSDEEQGETFDGLESAARHIRTLVAKRVRLRFAPELEFRKDQSIERATRIEALLSGLREKEKPASEDPID
jgi:ribosome-binding factor A